MTERMETAPKQRISVYCIAESLDRKLLQKRLEARGPAFMVTQYPDVLYGRYFSLETGQSMGDMCAWEPYLGSFLLMQNPCISKHKPCMQALILPLHEKDSQRNCVVVQILLRLWLRLLLEPDAKAGTLHQPTEALLATC